MEKKLRTRIKLRKSLKVYTSSNNEVVIKKLQRQRIFEKELGITKTNVLSEIRQFKIF